MEAPRYANGFEVTLQPDVVDAPRRWRKPRRVFVNSMSDLFHEDVPTEYIRSVFEVMAECPQHDFQVLTKRADRLRGVAHELIWAPNIWMGVSVESPKYYSRIEALSEVGARIRFLSVEPMLEACPDLPLRGIHWVIVGGESGPGARSIEESWVLDVRDQCRTQPHDVAFFFKQWGGVQKKRAGRRLQGEHYDGWPATAAK